MELLLQLLITLVVLFVLARLGSMIVTRFGLPGLIGEIVMGIVIANIAFGDGWSLMEDLLAIEMPDPVAGTEGSTVYQVVYAFAELGVIFLLFTVGLETKVKDLMNSGRPALLCAILGVIVPFVLGFALIMAWPNTAIGGGDMNHALFLAAAMVAAAVSSAGAVSLPRGMPKMQARADMTAERAVITMVAIFFLLMAVSPFFLFGDTGQSDGRVSVSSRGAPFQDFMPRIFGASGIPDPNNAKRIRHIMIVCVKRSLCGCCPQRAARGNSSAERSPITRRGRFGRLRRDTRAALARSARAMA